MIAPKIAKVPALAIDVRQPPDIGLTARHRLARCDVVSI